MSVSRANKRGDKAAAMRFFDKAMQASDAPEPTSFTRWQSKTAQSEKLTISITRITSNSG